MTTCLHCHTEHPEGHYERVVLNKTPLYGPWQGWRMAGRDLVAPDGCRYTPERLRGLAWRMEQSQRLNRAAMTRKRSSGRQTVKVVIVELADWMERRAYGHTSA